MKQVWKPGTMIYPLPAVLVGCGSSADDYNLLTAAWVGTICTNPPMCYVSIRPERHSHGLIMKTMEFTINLTTEEMARATDWCGVRSGSKYDKFRETGLTPEKGSMVDAPCVAESPLSVECRVKEVLHLGSHDMFIADVLCTRADERFIDPVTGAFDLQRAGLIAYSHGKYYALGEQLGTFGWSVRKKNTAEKVTIHK